MTSISTLEKKVVVVGDCGVGKTDFIAAIAGKKWRSKAKSPTVFDDRKVVFKLRNEAASNQEVDGEASYTRLSLTLADTSGDEEYDRLRPLSYLDSHVVVVCFSVDKKSSMKSVSGKWASEVAHFLPKVPVVLVATKSDLRKQQQQQDAVDGNAAAKGQPRPQDDDEEEDEFTNVAEGRYLSRVIKAQVYSECSAKTGDGIGKVRENIADILMNRDPNKQTWQKLARLVLPMS